MAYNPNKALHPGHTISRVLEGEGMSQKNLSERTGLTEKHLSQIINGEASITVETALLLENALGGTASFWISLEKNFQETKARVERASLLKEEVPLLSRYPYAELVKRGYVEPTTSREKKVEALWKFFGVNSLTYLPATESVAFRKRDGTEVKSEAIAAWLRCGEIEAKKQTTSAYSESLLKQKLDDLKKLSKETATQFSVKLKESLAEAGVSLVYVPHFPGTGVSGAVRWIGNSPVIQLSLYGAYADIFWFNLFHEIGHIVLHGKKEKFLEFDNRANVDSIEKEAEADQFATRILINEKMYSEFIQRNNWSKRAIVSFADSAHIHPGIVVGRLCHDGLMGWSSDMATLRTRLRFSDK